MYRIEYKRFFRRKIHFFFLGMVLLGSVLSAAYANQQNEMAKNNAISYYEQALVKFQSYEEEIEEAFKQNKLDINQREEELLVAKRNQSRMNEMIQHIQTENWNAFYQKNQQNYIHDGVPISLTIDSYDIAPETITNTIEISKYLEKNHLPSAFPIQLFLTAFEQPKSLAGEEVLYRIGHQRLKGTFYEWWNWHKTFGIYLMIIFMFGIFSNFFIHDATQNNRQIRLLLLSGLSIQQIVRKKIVVFFIMFMFVYFLCIMLSLIPSAIINGTGYWNYPITTYVTSSSTRLITYSMIKMELVPIGFLLVKAFWLQALFTIFSLGMGLIIIHLVKQEIAGSMLAFALIWIASLWKNSWNPFSYIQIGDLIDGSILFQTRSNQFTLFKGSMILGIGSVLVYFLLYWLMTKGQVNKG